MPGLSHNFDAFDKALNLYDFKGIKRICLYKVLAGILFLNDIEFQENADNLECVIPDSSLPSLERAADLLSIDVDDLKNALTKNFMQVQNQNIT